MSNKQQDELQKQIDLWHKLYHKTQDRYTTSKYKL